MTIYKKNYIIFCPVLEFGNESNRMKFSGLLEHSRRGVRSRSPTLRLQGCMRFPYIHASITNDAANLRRFVNWKTYTHRSLHLIAYYIKKATIKSNNTTCKS